jgi:Ca-activated chloride channel family protein
LVGLGLPVPGAQFRSGVQLVEVYATVTGEDGRPAKGLPRDAFTIREDGDPQTIEVFAAGEFPLALAVGIDRSFSVARKQLERAVTAVRGFLPRLRSEDRVMVIAIGSQVEVLAPLSDDRHTADTALGRLESWGTTPLYDASLEAIDAIQQAAGRRALILLSDGQDRYSRASAAEVLDAARSLDVLVYPIATGNERPPFFVELARLTGGRSFQVRDGERLGPTLDTIAEELRFQYLLGYVPPRSASAHPGWRSIDVSVDRSGARVRAREGYQARER